MCSELAEGRKDASTRSRRREEIVGLPRSSLKLRGTGAPAAEPAKGGYANARIVLETYLNLRTQQYSGLENFPDQFAP